MMIEEDIYIQLKRKIYLAVLPILLVSILSFWAINPNPQPLTDTAIPILSGLLALIWIAIYRHFYFRAVEMGCAAILSVFHAARFFVFPDQLEHATLSLYAMWSPLFFIFIFIAIKRNRALLYAIFIYLVTVALGIPHFQHSSEEVAQLTQFYISNLTYIIVLYYLQKLISTYIQFDMLEKIAYQDSLTHIGNRRMLDLWIEKEINRSENNPSACFSIIYFDIDHFKRVNDLFGHEAGDNVLRKVASLVKHNIRNTDYFGRWGGEEFIVVATNQSLHEVEELAERLRRIIDNQDFNGVGKITASFGIASFIPNDIPQSILKRADNALYMAKHFGRNNVKVV